jgi:predicted HTH domain antitoxin
MVTKRITIDLPDAFTAVINVAQQDLPEYIKKTLAVELYREGKLSLGKAAELAGTANKWGMLVLLNERKVPLHYTAEDADRDLQTLDEALQ